ncbi:MAG: putative S-layer protein, partial [Nanoarchaeota archaeon]
PGLPELSHFMYITASLISEAKAGEDLSVKSTVTNLGVEADLVVRATGFESWATLNSISDPIIHLKNGESKEVTLDFNVDKDATGEQSFFLEVLSGDRNERREVVANLAESTGTSSPGLNLQGNSLIWIIGIINVILIILIIVVAARISRR